MVFSQKECISQFYKIRSKFTSWHILLWQKKQTCFIIKLHLWKKISWFKFGVCKISVAEEKFSQLKFGQNISKSIGLKITSFVIYCCINKKAIHKQRPINRNRTYLIVAANTWGLIFRLELICFCLTCLMHTVVTWMRLI